jgi:hypothetical protein
MASLSGTALTAAALALAPKPVGFGSVALGSASSAASFTVTNNGQSATGPLAIGTSNTQFEITTNDCPTTLAAGRFCTVGVAFQPAAVGLQTGALSVSASPGGSRSASLSGTGTAELVVSSSGGGTVTSAPAGISCGATCTATFTQSAVTLSAMPDSTHSFDGWSDGGCSGTGPCPVSLTGPTTTVTASFTPLAAAQLAITPTSSDYHVHLMNTPTTATFTVTNNGDLPSGAPSVTLADATQFALGANTCTGILASHKTCTIDVDFVPTGVGVMSTTLTVSANPGGTTIASLSGTGASKVIVTVKGSGKVTFPDGTMVGPGAWWQLVTQSPAKFTAASSTSYGFVGWGDSCSGTGSCSVTLDTSPISVTAYFGPTVDITAPGPNQPTSSPVLLTFTAPAAKSFSCSYDNLNWAACSNPSNIGYATDGSRDGWQTLYVQGIDAANNVGPTASRTFWLDTMPPVITPSPTVICPLADGTFTVNFTSNEAAAFTCTYIDGTGTVATSCGSTSATSGSFSHAITADPNAYLIITGTDDVLNKGQVKVTEGIQGSPCGAALPCCNGYSCDTATGMPCNGGMGCTCFKQIR